MINIYLDDIRHPPSNRDWHIVRSYDQAIAWVEKHGMPDYISFDHDLGEEKTGYDFAKWLIDQDEQGIAKFGPGFDYAVHSANPVGAKNIRELFHGYYEYLKRQKASQ